MINTTNEIFEFNFINDEQEIIKLYNNFQQRDLCGNCYNVGKIYVYNREGNNIPHFHIKNFQFKNDVCLKICCAEYFKHGNKTGELTKKEREKLCKYLCTVNDEGKTIWNKIIETWNNHSITKIDINIEIPKYNEI